MHHSVTIDLAHLVSSVAGRHVVVPSRDQAIMPSSAIHTYLGTGRAILLVGFSSQARDACFMPWGIEGALDREMCRADRRGSWLTTNALAVRH